MRLDKYSNPIFTEQELFDALYKGHRFNSNDIVYINEFTEDISNLEDAIGSRVFVTPTNENEAFSINEFDTALSSNWEMPKEYQTLDIEAWIVQQCPPWDPEATRVAEELAEFKARNMLDLLRWLKYFVDTCTKENVLWGVGRGSSVASYVLYLIGVHKIDSIKYNLDWREFLR